jgi:hypothetical protein
LRRHGRRPIEQSRALPIGGRSQYWFEKLADYAKRELSLKFSTTSSQHPESFRHSRDASGV